MTNEQRVVRALERAGKPMTVAQIEKATGIVSGLATVLTKASQRKLIARVERGIYSTEAPAAAPTKHPAHHQLRGEFRTAVSLEANGEDLIISENGTQRRIPLLRVVELARKDGEPV